MDESRSSKWIYSWALVVVLSATSCQSGSNRPDASDRPVESPAGLGSDQSEASPFVMVLGIGQDGGVPQAGNVLDGRWNDLESRKLVSSLAIVDPGASAFWIIDATP
ncbi:MAG: hypothetical protein HKN13_12485, partial [Rhodothermales bacterium]|nr:hypothetical protein [Rhodothermales bacterium]